MKGGTSLNINLRRCMISDAEPIYRLCHEVLGYKFSQADVEANVRRLIGDPTNLLLVAEQNGEVVAFVHAHNHDPIYAPPMKSIVALAVTDDHRNQGLGHTLIQAVEDWARETGACAVRLDANEHMSDALYFYKSLGYDYIKTQYNLRKMLK